MAEVATGALHNVGNVLNSLGVSATLVLAGLRDSRVGNVQRVAQLLSEQGSWPTSFSRTMMRRAFNITRLITRPNRRIKN
jgi:hypothetical protein